MDDLLSVIYKILFSTIKKKLVGNKNGTYIGPIWIFFLAQKLFPV